jgi:dTDP-4-dehydrorhamnose reductase
MKLLLLGKNGQVGWEMQRALAPLGEVVALDRAGNSDLCGDLSDLAGIKNTIQTLKPDVIINAAAYTNVDKAETDCEAAAQINTHAVAVIADEAATLGALLVHYSTDYVFDGSGARAWMETDKPSPLNYYGVSKLAGERAIAASGCDHLIFRASWVYGAHGSNFIKTMLRLMSQSDKLRIVADQIGVPTGAALIADVTAQAIQSYRQDKKLMGLYHLAPLGTTSWFDFATIILDQAQRLGISLVTKNITPILSADYVTPACRPLNSRLDTTKLSTHFSIRLPSWEDGVIDVIRSLA